MCFFFGLKNLVIESWLAMYKSKIYDVVATPKVRQQHFVRQELWHFQAFPFFQQENKQLLRKGDSALFPYVWARKFWHSLESKYVL